MYADKITDSMRGNIDETERRRAKQIAYNGPRNRPTAAAQKIADILDQVLSGGADGTAVVGSADPGGQRAQR